MLRSKYNIFGFPHYALINQQGELIMNIMHCDSLAYYIKKNVRTNGQWKLKGSYLFLFVAQK